LLVQQQIHASGPLGPAAICSTWFSSIGTASTWPPTREFIAEATASASRAQTTRIAVASHADRSGSPRYDQYLLRHCADAVAAGLVARDMPSNEITVTAHGESRPLVPTANGMRAPQNRRVGIVLCQ
jgi:outer membrane protein OmpA-like peptidoglycan-associated protein